MKLIKVCEYSRSFNDDLILQDQASVERSQDQWSSGFSSVCLSVNVLCQKLRILKFGTKLGYVKLYYVFENQQFRLIIPLIYQFFSLFDKFFHHIISVCIRVREFKFYMHVQNDQLYY